MRRAMCCLLPPLLALAACQVYVPAPARPDARAASPRPSAASRPARAPSPGASVPTGADAVGVLPSSAPDPAPPDPATLVGKAKLSGTVAVDAGYLAAAGLLAAPAGGGLRVRAGSLISNNGGALVANNGATIVAEDGASLISDRGAAVAQVPRAFGLLAEGGSGGLSPVAGLMVAAVSLRSGEALGQAAFTDAAGAFTLEVPRGLEENVVVIAAVPATSPEDPVLRDPRLQFAVVTSPARPAAVIDEDATTAARYLRRCLVRRFDLLLDVEDLETFEPFLEETMTLPAARVAPLLVLIRDFHREARALGAAGWSADARLALGQRVTDAAIRGIDLGALELGPMSASDWVGPPEPAVPAMVGTLRSIRSRVAEVLAADPSAFASKPYLADLPDPATGRPFEVKRPSDLGDFLVNAYLVHNDPDAFRKLDRVLLDLGFEPGPLGMSPERHRLRAASDAVVGALGEAYVKDVNGMRAAILEAIRASVPTP